LSRGLPQLAPAAIAAGVAVAELTRRAGRWGPALAIVLLAVNAGMTTHRLFVRFARDPVVAAWYLKPDRDAADRILAQASTEPVALTGILDYGKDPVMLFYLGPALRRGDIVMTTDPPRQPYPVAVLRDPASGQPTYVLFGARRRWKGRPHLSLWLVDRILEAPENALLCGRLQDALADYERIARFLPDSMRVRTGLGVTLLRLGREREAIPHLEYALTCHPDEQARAVIEGALLRARRASPVP
jgi:tetratricopeptide (TPR) repeat protein